MCFKSNNFWFDDFYFNLLNTVLLRSRNVATTWLLLLHFSTFAFSLNCSGSVTLFVDCQQTKTVKMRPKAKGIVIEGNTIFGSSNVDTTNEVKRACACVCSCVCACVSVCVFVRVCVCE